MRRFMASLGSTGGGLFTKMWEAQVQVEATHGKWDVIHPSEDELRVRQMQFDQHEAHVSQVEVTRPEDAPPTYAETIRQLPTGFYFPKDIGISLPLDNLPSLVKVYPYTAPQPPSLKPITEHGMTHFVHPMAHQHSSLLALAMGQKLAWNQAAGTLGSCE